MLEHGEIHFQLIDLAVRGFELLVEVVHHVFRGRFNPWSLAHLLLLLELGELHLEDGLALLAVLSLGSAICGFGCVV